MSKIKKKSIVISVIAIIIIAIVILYGIINGGFVFMAPNYNRLDRYLNENIYELSVVVDALSKLEYDSISIRKTPLHEEDKYTMATRKDIFRNGIRINFTNEIIPIPEELLDNIEFLYNSGVDVISYGGTFIYFSMWSTMSESRGMIYSGTGRKPDDIQIIESKQLSLENWYYYVDNFEKAKARNPHLFK